MSDPPLQSSSQHSLPLSAAPTPRPAAPPAPAPAGGPAVRSLSSAEDLATRPPARTASRSSLIARSASRDAFAASTAAAGAAVEGGLNEAREGGAGTSSSSSATGIAMGRTTSLGGAPGAPILGQAGTSGILPPSSFFNPRIPGGSTYAASSSSSAVEGLASPTLTSSDRPMSALSSTDPLSPSLSSPTISSSASHSTYTSQPLPFRHVPTSPTSPGRERVRNGPVVTRIASAMSPTSPSSPPPLSVSPVPPGAYSDGRATPQPAPPRAMSPLSNRSRISLDQDLALSPEELAADLAAGGALARQGLESGHGRRRSSVELASLGGIGGAEGGSRPGSRLDGALAGREREREPSEASTAPAQHFSSHVLPSIHSHPHERSTSAASTAEGSKVDFPAASRALSSPPLALANAPPLTSVVLPPRPELPFSALPPRPSTVASRPPPPSTGRPEQVMLHIPLRPLSPRRRNYTLHPGSNRFPCAGRLISSADSPLPFGVALGVAVALPGLWWAFNGAFLWTHLGGGGKASLFVFVYVVLVMWSSMLKTALTDPGILPRNLDPSPPRKYVENEAEDGGEGEWRAEARYVRVGEGVVVSKWCETCHTYRPPRTSHCRLCDNCVERTDHHCAFLNNCIGRRNYLPFLAFLLSAVLSALYSLAFTAYHIAHAVSASHSELSRWDIVGAIVVLVLTVGMLVPVGGLAAYHARLVWGNRTTVEMLRTLPLRTLFFSPSTLEPLPPSTNLYSRGGGWRNCLAAWGAPGTRESAWERRGWAGEDARESLEGGKERE
ncbi:hypothetical protein JCM8097_004492 [Rhodosporidiobolus ruineniae]